MKLQVYADTGLLCSLYTPDTKTEEANRWIQQVSPPLPFTWLHQVEFRNALRLRVFRNQISTAEREGVLKTFLGDLAQGFYVQSNPEISEVLLEAERLGSSHTETLGCRSLDVLHVAMALVLGAETFAGFDQRQNQLAARAGLKTLPC